MKENWEEILKQKDTYVWDIPKEYQVGMLVDGRVYASESLLKQIVTDKSLDQVVNVAFLPGIVGYSLAMPDIHWGYGFPIGGVAATRLEDGVISPGGVGFDINCGVRLIRSNLQLKDVKDKMNQLVERLYNKIPSGVGSRGIIKLNINEAKTVLVEGSQWAVANGYGVEEDIVYTEENGKMVQANPDIISNRAIMRGSTQLGTLGSGNHFLEIQVIDRIYQAEKAKEMGLEEGMITILVHTGSRGFGHQVCTDHLSIMQKAVQRYRITLPDRQLACAPINSPEGRDYYQAMCCAANFAWANRQCITHWLREVFGQVFQISQKELGLNLVYDVAHNIAKMEVHEFKGKKMKLCVHRKGATRAFPPQHPDLPPKYKEIGQPVLIPGDMGRGSFVLTGNEKAMQETFGSTCHGAGRVLSRGAAKRAVRNRNIAEELRERNIIVKARSRETLAEEMSEAYKDVSEVVNVMDQSGISSKVARLRPLGVIKG
ncbi:MAG: RtcB family protein [Atribacterota bacterium]|nr:RtcB family protein [Atribacterota bacterium]